MKDEKKRMEELTARFLDGQTTEEEEQLLADYLENEKDLPIEWLPLRQMFRSFGSDAYDFDEEELDAMMAPCTPARPRPLRWLKWAAAACIVAAFLATALIRWSGTGIPLLADGAVEEECPQAEAGGADEYNLLRMIGIMMEASGHEIHSVNVEREDGRIIVKALYRDNTTKCYLLKQDPNSPSLELVSLSE